MHSKRFRSQIVTAVAIVRRLASFNYNLPKNIPLNCGYVTEVTILQVVRRDRLSKTCPIITNLAILPTFRKFSFFIHLASKEIPCNYKLDNSILHRQFGLLRIEEKFYY